jgi:hypothetical protein
VGQLGLKLLIDRCGRSLQHFVSDNPGISAQVSAQGLLSAGRMNGAGAVAFSRQNERGCVWCYHFAHWHIALRPTFRPSPCLTPGIVPAIYFQCLSKLGGDFAFLLPLLQHHEIHTVCNRLMWFLMQVLLLDGGNVSDAVVKEMTTNCLLLREVSIKGSLGCGDESVEALLQVFARNWQFDSRAAASV